MEKVYVIISYWYGTSDEAQYGEVSKVERVVRGTVERALEVEDEIIESIKDAYLFCYTDYIESEICE